MNSFRLAIALLLLFTLILTTGFAQPERWQQRAVYQMDIDFDVKTHRFTGTQKLIYFNHSNDPLNRVFYHLYFNAFQPESMMDVRSSNIADPDGRVKSRINSLGDKEIGYHKINALTMNGSPVQYEVVGTILEVTLNTPIEPGSSAIFDMKFESQVPLQIRRSGRDNAEGISYSMSQWYPKMAEYDYQGWHANPYVGREFYGVWGDFDVKITIDSDYIIGGSGYLQHPETIGYGYDQPNSGKGTAQEKLTWHFIAPNVHDFVWAADPDYTHDTFKRKDGLVMHFFYQKNEYTEENWAKLPKIMDRAFDFINEHYGQYPYEQYSFIQGGDGGMEYPMATLITGERSLAGLVGVSVHELMHSWYQMILGSNESLYAWMDEGFTTYASTEVMNFLRKEQLIPGSPSENPHFGNYRGYVNFAKSGYEEPLIIHADHFITNSAYGVGSYTKGSIFMNQLKYVVGETAFKKALLDYFDTWKFKHPNSNDVIRVFEKASDLELDWYREYFVNTTHTIDYGIKEITEEEGKTVVTLEKIGLMPMPVDLMIDYKDGKQELVTIPLRIMRGSKTGPKDAAYQFIVGEDWPWTNRYYKLTIDAKMADIAQIKIDPFNQMADVNTANNSKEMN